MAKKVENIYQREDGWWKNERNNNVKEYEYSAQLSEIVSKNKISFECMAEKWLTTLQSQIKKSTYCKYYIILDKYIFPKFGEKDINAISNLELQFFCDNLLINGGTNSKALSPKTVSDILSVMRGVLNYALIHGYYTSCTGRDVYIRKSTPDIVIISASDQKKLCKYLYEHISRKNLGVLICLFTGIRIGELCALKWDNISLGEKTMYIHKTMQRLKSFEDAGPKTYIDISSPKSKCSIRTIPFPDVLLSLIQDNYPNQQGYVLTSKENKFMEPRAMQTHFEKIQKKCGLEPVNFHALRHTFATRCIELGFDIKSLSEILGHASVNITMNRYVHPSMELKQQNMQKLSRLMEFPDM